MLPEYWVFTYNVKDCPVLLNSGTLVLSVALRGNGTVPSFLGAFFKGDICGCLAPQVLRGEGIKQRHAMARPAVARGLSIYEGTLSPIYIRYGSHQKLQPLCMCCIHNRKIRLNFDLALSGMPTSPDVIFLDLNRNCSITVGRLYPWKMFLTTVETFLDMAFLAAILLFNN